MGSLPFFPVGFFVLFPVVNEKSTISGLAERKSVFFVIHDSVSMVRSEKMNKVFVFCVVVVCFFVSGCGNPKVSGKVTLSDGTPIAKGEVIMQSDTLVAKGKIQKDGTYRMGTKKEFDGVPKGEYKVYLLATEEYKFPGPGGKLYTADELKALQNDPQAVSPMPVAIPSINKKYESPATSGLVCSVKGKTDFLIEVLPPDIK